MIVKVFRIFSLILLMLFLVFSYRNFFYKTKYFEKEEYKENFFDREKVEVMKDSNVFVTLLVPKTKTSEEEYKSFIVYKKLFMPKIFLILFITSLFLGFFYKMKKILGKIFENKF